MTSMGMNKSGTQTLPESAWTTLTGFTVRAGYPGTRIVNSKLRMDGPAPGAIRFRGAFVGSLGTQQFRVVKNGTDVLGSAVNAGAIGTVPAVTVDDGDTLELQGYAQFGGYADYGDVFQGAANTFLEFNQAAQNLTGSADRATSWGRTAALGIGGPLAPNLTETVWTAEASTTLDVPVSPPPARIAWEVGADVYKGEPRDFEVAHTTDWDIAAEMLHIQSARSLVTSFDDVSVSVHTVDGRGVGDFACTSLSGVTWGREACEVSACELSVLSEGDPELLERLRPWVHWITVWHAGRPAWTGPIQQVKIGRAMSTVSARDPSTFMWRTRVPVTRTWAGTDPSSIAASMLESLQELHRIPAAPIVLPGVTESFTYHADADSRMVHQMMDDLVKLGLHWTVVAGRFILGEFPVKPFTELAECDFLVSIDRLRDGTGTFNDVRIQGQNYAQTAVAPLAGLHLQTLVSLDDVYGVSNIQKATQRYADEVSAIRDVLQVPSSASLHPEAPVTLDELIPGRCIQVNANGVTSLMRVDQVSFSVTPDAYDTQVTLVAIQAKTELASLVQGGAGSEKST